MRLSLSRSKGRTKEKRTLGGISGLEKFKEGKRATKEKAGASLTSSKSICCTYSRNRLTPTPADDKYGVCSKAFNRLIGKRTKKRVFFFSPTHSRERSLPPAASSIKGKRNHLMLLVAMVGGVRVVVAACCTYILVPQDD